jgi:hypothetical protein
MDKLSAYLVLGCNGHSDTDGFLNCTGISNIIIDLQSLDDSEYLRLLDFLERSCNLFDEPVYNRNKVSNILSMIHRDYNSISHSMLFNIQSFMQMHKRCGHYLLLIMKEDYNNYV